MSLCSAPYRQLTIVLLLTAFLAAAATAAFAAETTAPERNSRITLDFKEIELPDLIQTISELTDKNFVYDESVKGKVTIISPDDMSLDEAYHLFLTVLSVKGYTVVPSGKVHKIVLSREARESNLPTVTRDEYRGEQFVTRLIPLRYVDATTLAGSVLTPLVPKSSNVVAYAPSNTLIITDNAANIDRIVKIIRQLDVPSSLELLEVIPLTHAIAEEVAKIATEVLAQTGSNRPRRVNRRQVAGAEEQSKILPYPRTNALVVLASQEDMTAIRDLVQRLDRKPMGDRSNINVYYLENADAEKLASTLNEILTGLKKKAPKQQGGQAGQATTLSNESVVITADKSTNALIVNATPEDYEVLRGIIEKLDIKRKQVYVEALILELSMDATQRLGASLQGAVDIGDDSVTFGTSNFNTGPAVLTDLVPGDDNIPGLLGKTIEGILLGGFFNPITTIGPNGEEIVVPALSALIDLSKTDNDVNILSAPRLLTSDNEEAEIIVGSNVPVITGRLTDTGSSGLAQSVSIERRDVALILRFTPQITEGDLVRLDVYQELTNIAPSTPSLTASVGNPEDVGPTFTKRLLRNTVVARNNRTIVLGGLIDTNVRKTVRKVPLLGDIPLLGWLFKRVSSTEEKTNLLVFINPTIIKETTDLDRITRQNRETADTFLSEEMRRSLPRHYESPQEGATAGDGQ